MGGLLLDSLYKMTGEEQGRAEADGQAARGAPRRRAASLGPAGCSASSQASPCKHGWLSEIQPPAPPVDALLKEAQRGVQGLLLAQPHPQRRRAPAAGRDAAAAAAGQTASAARGRAARQEPARCGAAAPCPVSARPRRKRAQTQKPNQPQPLKSPPVERCQVLVDRRGVARQRRGAAVDELLQRGAGGGGRERHGEGQAVELAAWRCCSPGQPTNRPPNRRRLPCRCSPLQPKCGHSACQHTDPPGSTAAHSPR